MTRFAFLLLPFAVACSSSPPASQNDSGAENDAAVASDADASTPQKDAQTPSDAGVDAASDPFVPHPPAGSTKCGSGVVDATSAHAACTEPSWILDDMPLVDGGMGAMPRACDALTIGAGEWQVWCSPTNAYVWMRVPITNADTLKDCHGSSLLMVDEGLWQYANGGGNGGATIGTYESNGTAIAGTVPGDPQTLVASILVQTNAQNKAASLWIAGNLEDTCNNAIFDPPVVLTGVDVTWK